jgi:hypothetical protein
MTPEDPGLEALRASTDQYTAGLRDLAEATPAMAEVAAAMAAMIRALCPGADGNTVIAAAQAANGARAIIEHAGGTLNEVGIVNLIALAGRALTETDAAR